MIVWKVCVFKSGETITNVDVVWVQFSTYYMLLLQSICLSRPFEKKQAEAVESF